MSTNNFSLPLSTVEKIVQRIVSAEKAQQREVRLTIQEARDLTAELATVTTKLGKTLNDIHDSLEEIKKLSSNSSNANSGSFDGGTF